MMPLSPRGSLAADRTAADCPSRVAIAPLPEGVAHTPGGRHPRDIVRRAYFCREPFKGLVNLQEQVRCVVEFLEHANTTSW